MKQMIPNRNRSSFWGRGLAFLFVALAMPVSALATTTSPSLGTSTQSFASEQLAYLPNIVTAICFIAGLIIIASGVIKLKENADGSNSAKVQHGIGRLVTGAALVALPVFAQWIIDTIKMTGTNASYTNFGTTNLTSFGAT